ncbi:unnamed protein product, partial [Urochloa humidicola]
LARTRSGSQRAGRVGGVWLRRVGGSPGEPRTPATPERAGERGRAWTRRPPQPEGDRGGWRLAFPSAWRAPLSFPSRPQVTGGISFSFRAASSWPFWQFTRFLLLRILVCPPRQFDFGGPLAFGLVLVKPVQQDAVTVRDGALLFEAAPLEGRSHTREEVQVLADGYTTNAPCRGHLPSASPRHPPSVRNGNSEQSQPQDEQCIPIVQIRLHF